MVDGVAADVVTEDSIPMEDGIPVEENITVSKKLVTLVCKQYVFTYCPLLLCLSVASV